MPGTKLPSAAHVLDAQPKKTRQTINYFSQVLNFFWAFLIRQVHIDITASLWVIPSVSFINSFNITGNFNFGDVWLIEKMLYSHHSLLLWKISILSPFEKSRPIQYTGHPWMPLAGLFEDICTMNPCNSLVLLFITVMQHEQPKAPLDITCQIQWHFKRNWRFHFLINKPIWNFWAWKENINIMFKEILLQYRNKIPWDRDIEKEKWYKDKEKRETWKKLLSKVLVVR